LDEEKLEAILAIINSKSESKPKSIESVPAFQKGSLLDETQKTRARTRSISTRTSVLANQIQDEEKNQKLPEKKKEEKEKNQQNVEKQNTFNSEYQNLIQFHTRERFNNFRIYLTSAEYQVDFRLPHYEKINWTPEKDIPCFRLVCNKIVRDLREEESTLDSKNEKTNELIKKLRRQQMTVSRKY